MEVPTHNLLNPSDFHFPDPMLPHISSGREEDITDITNLILNETIFKVNIVGPPGYGKTTLALSVGQYLKEMHGYNVAYAAVDQGSQISSALRKILSSFGCHDVQHGLYQTVNDIHFPSHLVLLIIDDINQLIKPSRAEYDKVVNTLVNSHKIKVIQTTTGEWERQELGTVSFKVELLSLHASSQFILSLNPGMKLKEAELIADVIQGVPLLLHIIGHALKAELLSANGLIHMIQEYEFEIDPSNSSSYFPLLRQIFMKTSPHLQITFIHFASGILDSKTEAYFQLADLGFMEYNSTSDNHVQFEMHSILKEFAATLGLEYLVQYQGIPHMQPLPVILFLGLVVNLLTKLCAFTENTEFLKTISLSLCLWFGLLVSYYTIEYIYINLTAGEKLFSNSLTAVHSAVVCLGFASGVICMKNVKFNRRQLIGSTLKTTLCWLHSFTFLLLFLYMSTFTVSYFKYIIQVQGVKGFMISMKTSTIHLVISVFLGFVTIVRTIDVDSSKNILALYIGKSIQYVNFGTLKFISKHVVMFLCWLCVCAICIFYSKTNHKFYNTHFEVFISESVPLHITVLLAYGSTVIKKMGDQITAAILLIVLFSLYMVSITVQDHASGVKLQEASVRLETFLALFIVYVDMIENKYPKVDNLFFGLCISYFITFVGDLIHIILLSFQEDPLSVPNLNTKSFHVVGCTYSIWILWAGGNVEERRTAVTYPASLIAYHVIQLMWFMVTGGDGFINMVLTFLFDSAALPFLIHVPIFCFTRSLHIMEAEFLMFLFILYFFYLPSQFLYFLCKGEHILLTPSGNTTFNYRSFPADYFAWCFYSLLALSVLVILSAREGFKHSVLALLGVFISISIIVCAYYLAYVSNMLYHEYIWDTVRYIYI